MAGAEPPAGDNNGDQVNGWYRDTIDQQMGKTGAFLREREPSFDRTADRGAGGPECSIPQELAGTAELVAMSGPEREAYWQQME